MKRKNLREVYLTAEYEDFYNNADDNVKKKIEYLVSAIKKEQTVNTKIAKKLVNTIFYELRIVLKNQYRVILFTIDNEDINQCSNILFINGFIKKSTKDYQKQIKKAHKIVAQWEQDQN